MSKIWLIFINAVYHVLLLFIVVGLVDDSGLLFFAMLMASLIFLLLSLYSVTTIIKFKCIENLKLKWIQFIIRLIILIILIFTSLNVVFEVNIVLISMSYIVNVLFSLYIYRVECVFDKISEEYMYFYNFYNGTGEIKNHRLTTDIITLGSKITWMMALLIVLYTESTIVLSIQLAISICLFINIIHQIYEIINLNYNSSTVLTIIVIGKHLNSIGRIKIFMLMCLLAIYLIMFIDAIKSNGFVINFFPLIICSMIYALIIKNVREILFEN